ncbi:RHH/CopG DNA binding protein [Candidatus Nanobsidianus stetteri]|uniref:RHH/CopG DNA binding protein n=1 Tax=Nanobsidianus stetteri TaxID=1294122 RepID=R1E527_NANST|nr:RHH/CopG DNA binding protein [Candidatus Nanobsidianus stetteri]
MNIKNQKSSVINIFEVLKKALREKIKRKEEEKMLEAIKRLGELLEKTGATPEETIKIIREIREEK